LEHAVSFLQCNSSGLLTACGGSQEVLLLRAWQPAAARPAATGMRKLFAMLTLPVATFWLQGLAATGMGKLSQAATSQALEELLLNLVQIVYGYSTLGVLLCART